MCHCLGSIRTMWSGNRSRWKCTLTQLLVEQSLRCAWYRLHLYSAPSFPALCGNAYHGTVSDVWILPRRIHLSTLLTRLIHEPFFCTRRFTAAMGPLARRSCKVTRRFHDEPACIRRAERVRGCRYFFAAGRVFRKSTGTDTGSSRNGFEWIANNTAFPGVAW